MLTWSLGWASSPASLAITSFAFMFEEVPEPVWKTSIGNWSSCLPSATSSPALRDLLGDLLVELAELGVGPGGGGLQAAQPVDHRRRDRLPGDLEVLDRLRRLTAPEFDLPSSGGYLSALVPRREPVAEGALELGGRQALGAEARRGVSRRTRSAWIPRPRRPARRRRPGSRAGPRPGPPGPRWPASLSAGRGGDHLLADRRQLAALLLGHQAVRDRRLALQPDLAGGRAQRLQVGVAARQAGRGGRARPRPRSSRRGERPRRRRSAAIACVGDAAHAPILRSRPPRPIIWAP